MGTYAATTSVPAEQSRAQIERDISRYGARQFAYGWSEGHAMVAFHVKNRQVRFALPMPNPSAEEFRYTPQRRQARTPKAREEAYQQAVRQRWRALALVIKAKLEAVETEIVTFEQEFAMHMVLPDGRTVAEHVLPAIDTAYATGVVPPMLALPSGKGDS